MARQCWVDCVHKQMIVQKAVWGDQVEQCLPIPRGCNHAAAAISRYAIEKDVRARIGNPSRSRAADEILIGLRPIARVGEKSSETVIRLGECRM